MPDQDTSNDGDGLLEESIDESTPDSTIGRIALKQVRVSRAEVEARTREGEAKKPAGSNSPLNRLVPYLDLFCRLTDDELSRLARTPTSAVETLRLQVDEVGRALIRYVDLLPRLSDDELVRLTGATPKTIRFWRLCQPRSGADTRSRSDVPQVSPRETSAVRSVAQAIDESSDQMQVRQLAGESMSAMPAAGESGTMIVDEQIARFRRE
ncbi:hypothetical protein ACNOYE_09625 [Nannocystaceae bacterium ST9]